jgi:hypothetical protein
MTHLSTIYILSTLHGLSALMDRGQQPAQFVLADARGGHRLQGPSETLKADTEGNVDFRRRFSNFPAEATQSDAQPAGIRRPPRFAQRPAKTSLL